MAIANKLMNVPDSVCEGCPQNYKGECRAFLVAFTVEERQHRSTPYVYARNCDTRTLTPAPANKESLCT